jgi:hypothetical protein
MMTTELSRQDYRDAVDARWAKLAPAHEKRQLHCCTVLSEFVDIIQAMPAPPLNTQICEALLATWGDGFDAVVAAAERLHGCAGDRGLAGSFASLEQGWYNIGVIGQFVDSDADYHVSMGITGGTRSLSDLTEHLGLEPWAAMLLTQQMLVINYYPASAEFACSNDPYERGKTLSPLVCPELQAWADKVWLTVRVMLRMTAFVNNRIENVVKRGVKKELDRDALKAHVLAACSPKWRTWQNITEVHGYVRQELARPQFAKRKAIVARLLDQARMADMDTSDEKSLVRINRATITSIVDTL